MIVLQRFYAELFNTLRRHRTARGARDELGSLLPFNSSVVLCVCTSEWLCHGDVCIIDFSMRRPSSARSPDWHPRGSKGPLGGKNSGNKVSKH